MKLDPFQRAAAKHAARCPDCDSTVSLDDRSGVPRVSVHHDDECPMLAALQRQGRTSSIALVRRADQTPEELAEDTIAVVRALAAAGTATTVRLDPYVGGPQ